MPVGWTPPNSGGGGGGGGGQSDLGLSKAGGGHNVSVVNACTSTTNWVSTASGPIATATVAGETCVSAGLRDGLVQHFYYQPPSPLPLPDSNLIRLRISWNRVSLQVSNMYEVVMTDQAALAGNIVTFTLPAGMIENLFFDLTLSLEGLTQLACVGIRTITPTYNISGTSAANSTFYISEIDFPVENGVSAGRALGQTLVVPGDYTPSTPGYPYLDGPAARLDFLTRSIEGFRGVKHIRDFNLVNSGDVTAQLQAILGSLQPGDIFEFEPDAVYQISESLDLSHLSDVTLIGNNAAIQIDALYSRPIIRIGLEANNVRIIGLRVYGTKEETTTADLVANRATNMARPEVNQNGTVWIPVISEWTAETNAGTPGPSGGIKISSYPNAMQIVPSGAGALSSVITATARRYPVTVGVSYTCEIAATSYRTSGTAYARTMSLDLVWYDSGGSVLSTTTGPTQVTSTAGRDWKVLTVTGTAPASAAKVGVRINIANPTTSAERHYFDQMQLYRTTAPTNAISGTSKILAAPGDGLTFPEHADGSFRHVFYATQPNGKSLAGVTLSGSAAQSDAVLFRVRDKRTDQTVYAEYLDVTTSPTLNIIEWTPPDLEAPVELTIQNAAVTTPITVTVDSIYEYGRSVFNGAGDNMSGFVIEDDAHGILLRDIRVEGVYGDAVDVTGRGVRDVVIENLYSRAVGRQGMSANRVKNIRISGLTVIGCGRSGIDIEPYQADWSVDGVTISDVRLAYINNLGMACTGWARIQNMSISNLVGVNCGAGLFRGGGRNVSFSNVSHQVTSLTSVDAFDVQVYGHDMVGTITAGWGARVGIDQSLLVMDGDGQSTTYTSRPCPGLMVNVVPGDLNQFHNLAFSRTDLGGSAHPLRGTIADPGTDPPYTLGSSPYYSGGIGSDSADIDVVDFDPGPLRRWFPNTFKGVMNQNTHFLGGLNLRDDPIVRTRSLSATSTRANNLRGIEASVTLAATSKVITFPSFSGTHPSTIDSNVYTNVAGSAATLTLVSGTTYQYRAAPIIERGRGPSAAPATAPSLTFSGSNPIRMTLKKLVVPEPDASATGYMPYGWVIYRSEDGGVSYNVRYTITPTVDFPSVSNNWTLHDYGGAIAPDLSNDNVWGWATTYASEANSGLPVDESGWEPDTSYAVMVVPNWSTTCYVTSKTRSGFTVEFGTAAPANAKIDWMIVR